MEWTDKYNPFNSFKALVHADNFEQIIKSEKEKGKIKPPIVVNMDLTNKCNYNCRFCMFGGNRKRMDNDSQFFRANTTSLPLGYAPLLPKIWKIWGVKASCLAGGGEPALHPDCLPLIKACKKNKIELGFVTNGFLVNNQEWFDTLCDCCKFVGFSIDAGTEEDYHKVKRVPEENFIAVLENMSHLVDTKKERKSNVQLGFKFLLDEFNYKHIYEACEYAKEIGCNHFQFRPAINYNNVHFFKDKLDSIWNQIAKAQKDFETKDFKVIGVQHKHNPDLSKAHNFEKCRATMLTSTWCADGKVYLCTDSRGCQWAYLCNYYPNPQKVVNIWGSKKHWDIINKIDFKKNCDRCTLAPYNEFFEQVFINDRMDRYLI